MNTTHFTRWGILASNTKNGDESLFLDADGKPYLFDNRVDAYTKATQVSDAVQQYDPDWTYKVIGVSETDRVESTPDTDLGAALIDRLTNYTIDQGWDAAGNLRGSGADHANVLYEMIRDLGLWPDRHRAVAVPIVVNVLATDDLSDERVRQAVLDTFEHSTLRDCFAEALPEGAEYDGFEPAAPLIREHDPEFEKLLDDPRLARPAPLLHKP